MTMTRDEVRWDIGTHMPSKMRATWKTSRKSTKIEYYHFQLVLIKILIDEVIAHRSSHLIITKQSCGIFKQKGMKKIPFFFAYLLFFLVCFLLLFDDIFFLLLRVRFRNVNILIHNMSNEIPGLLCA